MIMRRPPFSQKPGPGLSRRVALVALGSCLLPGFAHAGATVQSLADAYATDALSQGLTSGLELAVVIGNSPPQFFGYGVKDVGTGAPTDPHTIFLIASISKVFTTNLLGQNVAAGTNALNQPLSSFTAELGKLPANTGAITLEQLTDFTGGIPFLPPSCKKHQMPSQDGCRPGMTPPPITEYSAADFAKFFDTYITAGPPPQSYIYSDAALGLAGLLLGATPGAPLDNSSLTKWANLVGSAITTPLSMNDTSLFVPAQQVMQEATGYTTAVAQPTVSGGGVATVKLSDPGSGYTAAPDVTITGGGGTGATAKATLNAAGSVSSIVVTNPGSGYVAPAKVFFRGGGGSGGAGRAVVENGAVVGVQIINGGSFSSAPSVVFKGGRIKGGRDAAATAYIDNGTVTYVQINDGGAGYVTPASIAVTASPGVTSVIPIWAASSGLSSSAADLATFAAAALLQTTIGGQAVPPAITAGFQIAETPYACSQGNPSLTGCTGAEAGLAWSIQPGPPQTVSKDGGVPGFSSFITLMPSQNIAVVALANTRNRGGGAAPVVARSLLYALYHEGLTGHRR